MLLHIHFHCQLTYQEIIQLINQSTNCFHIRQSETGCSLLLGHNKYLIPVLDAVRVQSPGVVLHFLWTKGAALVDVIEPHAVSGQLDHCSQLLLQLCYGLVQTDPQLTQKQTGSTF